MLEKAPHESSEQESRRLHTKNPEYVLSLPAVSLSNPSKGKSSPWQDASNESPEPPGPELACAELVEPVEGQVLPLAGRVERISLDTQPAVLYNTHLTSQY